MGIKTRQKLLLFCHEYHVLKQMTALATGYGRLFKILKTQKKGEKEKTITTHTPHPMTSNI